MSFRPHYLHRGEGSRKNVITVKALVKSPSADFAPVVPIVIPSLEEVRNFAMRLHSAGEAWQGEAFGWQAEYNPERTEPPLESRMTFTPADFCIGESGIWFYSLMWEAGRDKPAVEFLDDVNIVGTVVLS
jgi:hypothetical protein